MTGEVHAQELAVEEDDVADGIVTKSLQVLNQLLVSRSRPSDDAALFDRRLRSFTVTSYYARPICLSSFLCAASGWEIQSHPDLNPPSVSTPPVTTDSLSVLTCSSCNSHLAIKLPRSLSLTGQRKIMSHYQKQLWNAHTMTCRYRDIARLIVFGSEQTTTETKSSTFRSPVIPTVLSRMLPPNRVALDLLERFDPRHQFKNQWLKLYPTILKLSETLDASDSLALNRYNDEDSAPSSNLLDDLVQMIAAIPEDEQSVMDTFPQLKLPLEIKAASTAAAIVLTGWDLIVGDTGNSSSAIQCSLCLSCQPLIRLNGGVVETAEDELVEPKSCKRRKTRESTKWNQPVSAHRYFCPWVCGLPCRTDPLANGSPLWQIMADRMKHSITLADANTVDDAVVSIHTLLRSGISSHRFDAPSIRE